MDRRFIETCTTATAIVRAGGLKVCRDFIDQTGRPLLSREVVLHHNLDGATCAACGVRRAFQDTSAGLWNSLVD